MCNNCDIMKHIQGWKLFFLLNIQNMKNDFNQMENLLKLSGEQIFIQISVGI